MIVKILAKSSTFASVDYNERKVAQGSALLIDLQNFSYLQDLGIYDSAALRQYLVDYSSQNDRIKYPQFHVTMSCKGDEYTHDQLKELAYQYLEKMGYKNEGQPLLIYAHRDTDNNHIHIITSRVAPDGHKIAHSFERSRSQQAMDEILGIDSQKQLDKAISNATAYKYENINQFKAILEATGYESYEENDNLMIKRNGGVVATLPIAEITKGNKKDYLTDKRKKQLKAIVKKYQAMAGDKAELKDMLKQKFGLDLVFVGSKDTPYGYMIVDHKDKAVYKGSAIMPIKQLLAFTDKSQRLSEINTTIDKLLEDNNRLTTRELNAMLRRQFAGSYIAKGTYIQRFLAHQLYYT